MNYPISLPKHIANIKKTNSNISDVHLNTVLQHIAASYIYTDMKIDSSVDCLSSLECIYLGGSILAGCKFCAHFKSNIMKGKKHAPFVKCKHQSLRGNLKTFGIKTVEC